MRDLLGLGLRWVLLAALLLAVGGTVVAAPGGPADQERVRAAIREGELNWLDCVAGPDTARVLAERFRRYYGLPPSFRVNHTLQSSAGLAAVISEEVRAGRITYDVVTCATPGLFYDLLRQGALMRYESPEYRFYNASRRAGLTEEPGYWVSPWAYTFVIAWNPRLVQDEFRSWRDILKPAYRGKIVMGDPMRSLTYLDSYIGLRKVLDERFFQQLADLQPFFLVRSEDIMSRVVSGEYPVAFWGMPTRAYQAARRGVEVRVSYPQEGAVLLGSPWVILARAPHPNAARLWIDFIYAKIGHQIYIINEALSTARDDMPVPSQLRKFTPPVWEIQSIRIEWNQMTDATRAQAREEFRRLFRR